ncbi:hypothetical protein HGT73_11580 [Rosenbergiella australiborealis]|uniref:ImpA N-terminal domain-containing protein n=1 Tax=Rosenbergiella australiborealis TaxID=1544696 RepID=A0ABS5T6M4_9GAMM|nr:type VI secretion system ImpA family N-terminal domain-containing protein [Rosenbergiella australiborealis]MBT0728005.1 hypothetical protein [Rosenbergiella australiborealis]
MSALTAIFTHYPWLGEPIDPSLPCGPAIDYHPEFLALQQQISPQNTVEYGEFIQASSPIHWPSLLPTLYSLSQQSKDIRLVILLIRARLAQEGIKAIVEGIELLIALLERWPQALHPQCHDEGEYVPEFRHNALSGLDDREGCVAELRHFSLTTPEGQAYSLAQVEQWIRDDKTLSLADKERLQQCYHHHHYFFEHCLIAQQRLQQLCQLPDEALGTDSFSCPHLTQLFTTLCRFHQKQRQLLPPELTAVAAEPAVLQRDPPAVTDRLAYRNEAREKLREIRENFTYYEPSSPLSLLLHFAEHSIGLDCQQISQRYPRELLTLLTLEKDI